EIAEVDLESTSWPLALALTSRWRNHVLPLEIAAPRLWDDRWFASLPLSDDSCGGPDIDFTWLIEALCPQVGLDPTFGSSTMTPSCDTWPAGSRADVSKSLHLRDEVLVQDVGEVVRVLRESPRFLLLPSAPLFDHQLLPDLL